MCNNNRKGPQPADRRVAKKAPETNLVDSGALGWTWSKIFAPGSIAACHAFALALAPSMPDESPRRVGFVKLANGTILVAVNGGNDLDELAQELIVTGNFANFQLLAGVKVRGDLMTLTNKCFDEKRALGGIHAQSWTGFNYGCAEKKLYSYLLTYQQMPEYHSLIVYRIERKSEGVGSAEYEGPCYSCRICVAWAHEHGSKRLNPLQNNTNAKK